jgi:hypothetical protein
MRYCLMYRVDDIEPFSPFAKRGELRYGICMADESEPEAEYEIKLDIFIDPETGEEDYSVVSLQRS